MAFNSATDFVGLIREDSSIYSQKRMPSIDFMAQSLANLGLITLVAGDTAPVANQATTAFLDTAAVDYSANGTLYLWNSVTSAYALATPSLFGDLLAAASSLSVTTVHSGSGVPSNGLGVNGDYYLDTDTLWSVYGPKTAGAWPATVLIEGTAKRVMYTADGTDAVPRTVHARLAEVFFVNDYGPTGTSDDSATVLRAITAANGNGLLYFGAGVTTVDNITLPAGSILTFLGAGQGVSIIKQKDGGSGMFNAPAAVEFFEMRDITIDGNKANMTDETVQAFDIIGDTQKYISSEFKNTVRSAIRMRDLQVLGLVSGCRFRDNATINEVSATAADILFVHVTQATAQDSIFEFCDNQLVMPAPVSTTDNPAGVVVNTSRATVATANQKSIIERNLLVNLGVYQAAPSIGPSSPIHAYKNASNSIIRDNIIEGACVEAIRWQKSDNILIEGNIIDGEGAYVEGSKGPISVENRTADLGVRELFNIIIRSNIINNMPSYRYGIYCNLGAAGEAGGVDIIGNTVNTCEGGVYVNGILDALRVCGNNFKTITVGKVIEIAELNNLVSRVPVWLDDNKFFNCQDRPIFMGAGATNAYVNATGNYMEQVGVTSGGSAIDIRDVEQVHYDDNTLVAGTGGITSKYGTGSGVASIVGSRILQVNYDNVSPAQRSEFNLSGNVVRNGAGDYVCNSEIPTGVDCIPTYSSPAPRVDITILSASSIGVETFNAAGTPAHYDFTLSVASGSV